MGRVPVEGSEPFRTGDTSLKAPSAWYRWGRLFGTLRLNLSPSDVPGVMQRLGIGTPLAKASAAEIFDLLSGGTVIELDNGWRLNTAGIAGDEVVELVLNGVAANREELERHELSKEVIGYKRRRFWLLDNATKVLPPLLAHRKPIRDPTALDAPWRGEAEPNDMPD